jgi:hypothetical protein
VYLARCLAVADDGTAVYVRSLYEMYVRGDGALVVANCVWGMGMLLPLVLLRVMLVVVGILK